MFSPHNIYNKKLIHLSWIILLYFGIIAFRLIHLQIIQYQRFATWGEKNFLRYKVIPAQRGNILDCHGVPLAMNQPVTQLIWKGTGNSSLTQQQETAIAKINEILCCEPICMQKIKRAEKFSTELVIAESITHEQLSLIAEQCSEILNLTFNTRFERFYPYDTLASHILGYLGDMHEAISGKMGLEKICEETLRGNPGILRQSINSFGSLLDCQEIKQESSGEDIKTSIDLDIQLMLENCMADQLEGSCIIIEPKTGLIKALVSKPNFQPTIFSKKLSPQQWQDMQKQQIFLNRAFNASYPPASIFKLVTIATALEEKLMTTQSVFMCNGFHTFKDRKYYCHKHTGHGRISAEECLSYSCNIPFFELAQHMHIDTLASYAFEFGLGNKTNVPFCEQHGLIPTNEWKIAHKGERWWTGETLSAAIGQSFLLVTPIQVACMIGSIFHGYLVKPRITLDSELEKKPINISQHTRQFLQNCMKMVATTGTGRRIMHKIGDLTIYAKTGTAQTKTRLNSQDPDDMHTTQRLHKEHAWFVSYFYTDDTEPLVLVMLLEHVGKSSIAVNATHTFLVNYMKWLRKKNVETIPT
ncbi:MAG TPA: penicillin-binding transpeptidase domain-containing protein [Candidatus Saccharimonadales bacterium]|nr:penicillin-binding transpeptidase domain-containing protein [Candidatus Saccharimonadales bacterium]